MVVHLDSQVFKPVMPDRTHLYNADNSMKLLDDGCHAIVVEFLVLQKAMMDGKEFLLTYEETCRRRGLMHLLNDIPLLSSSAMGVILQCHYQSDERWGPVRLGTDTISREDILSGKVVVWRDVPEELDDSRYAIVLQKMMRRKGVLSLDKNYHSDHWIYQCTPSCHDFIVSVEPIGAAGSGKHWLDNHDCTVQMVEAIKVSITSSVDPDFRLEETWSDEWVLFSVEDDDESSSDQEVTIFVTPKDSSPDWPTSTLCSFMNEYDRHQEDWEDDAIKAWRSLLAGLSGQSMASSVEIAISDVGFTLQDKHAGQMVMLTSSRRWNDYNKSYGKPLLDVIDLEDEQFWRKFAELAAKDLMSAESLKQAFKDAAGVRELVGGPEM